jgi:hypothetical protein
MEHKFNYIVCIIYGVFVFHLIHLKLEGEEIWDKMMEWNRTERIPSYTTSFYSFLKNPNNGNSLHTTIYHFISSIHYIPSHSIKISGKSLYSIIPLYSAQAQSNVNKHLQRFCISPIKEVLTLKAIVKFKGMCQLVTNWVNFRWLRDNIYRLLNFCMKQSRSRVLKVAF